MDGAGRRRFRGRTPVDAAHRDGYDPRPVAEPSDDREPGEPEADEPEPALVSYAIAVFLVILIPTLLCIGLWFIVRLIDRFLIG